jgi:hypothetical protein
MVDQHNRIIADAAELALSPLGLVRKGRSRIWLDDQSWWLGIVEFKSSNRKPGSYLNVGLMFLWRPIDRYIFDIGHQVEGFSAADSADFIHAARAKAELAAYEIQNLRAGFRTLDDVISYYTPMSGRTSIYAQAHLATALCSVGNMEHCRRALDRALKQREEAPPALRDGSAWLLTAREMAEDAGAFRAWIVATTKRTRQDLGLSNHFELPAALDVGDGSSSVTGA